VTLPLEQVPLPELGGTMMVMDIGSERKDEGRRISKRRKERRRREM